jgi:hypothetical protein
MRHPRTQSRATHQREHRSRQDPALEQGPHPPPECIPPACACQIEVELSGACPASTGIVEPFLHCATTRRLACMRLARGQKQPLHVVTPGPRAGSCGNPPKKRRTSEKLVTVGIVDLNGQRDKTVSFLEECSGTIRPQANACRTKEKKEKKTTKEGKEKTRYINKERQTTPTTRGEERRETKRKNQREKPHRTKQRNTATTDTKGTTDHHLTLSSA